MLVCDFGDSFWFQDPLLCSFSSANLMISRFQPHCCIYLQSASDGVPVGQWFYFCTQAQDLQSDKTSTHSRPENNFASACGFAVLHAPKYWFWFVNVSSPFWALYPPSSSCCQMSKIRNPQKGAKCDSFSSGMSATFKMFVFHINYLFSERASFEADALFFLSRQEEHLGVSASFSALLCVLAYSIKLCVGDRYVFFPLLNLFGNSCIFMEDTDSLCLLTARVSLRALPTQTSLRGNQWLISHNIYWLPFSIFCPHQEIGAPRWTPSFSWQYMLLETALWMYFTKKRCFGQSLAGRNFPLSRGGESCWILTDSMGLEYHRRWHSLVERTLGGRMGLFGTRLLHCRFSAVTTNSTIPKAGGFCVCAHVYQTESEVIERVCTSWTVSACATKQSFATQKKLLTNVGG